MGKKFVNEKVLLYVHATDFFAKNAASVICQVGFGLEKQKHSNKSQNSLKPQQNTSILLLLWGKIVNSFEIASCSALQVLPCFSLSHYMYVKE